MFVFVPRNCHVELLDCQHHPSHSFRNRGHDQASLSRSGCSSSGPNHAWQGVEYVPQIWGKYALKNISNMNVTFIQGASSIFSFNEPDHTGSSWLPPAEAAERWPNMVALARAFNLTLVAPCLSNSAGGQWWMETWNAGCRTLTGTYCSYDHTCLHTYFEPNDTASLFSSLARMHNDHGRPIWLVRQESSSALSFHVFLAHPTAHSPRTNSRVHHTSNAPRTNNLCLHATSCHASRRSRTFIGTRGLRRDHREESRCSLTCPPLSSHLLGSITTPCNVGAVRFALSQ